MSLNFFRKIELVDYVSIKLQGASTFQNMDFYICIMDGMWMKIYDC